MPVLSFSVRPLGTPAPWVVASRRVGRWVSRGQDAPAWGRWGGRPSSHLALAPALDLTGCHSVFGDLLIGFRPASGWQAGVGGTGPVLPLVMGSFPWNGLATTSLSLASLPTPLPLTLTALSRQPASFILGKLPTPLSTPLPQPGSWTAVGSPAGRVWEDSRGCGEA